MKPEYFSPVLASGKEDIGRIAQTLADRMNAYLVETFGSPEEGKAACRGEALDFLNTLDPEATKYDFWVLTPDGSKNPKPVPHHRIGTLDKWFDWMWGMNRAGGGVFVTVHASDGRGRKTENITRPRAIIADFDKGIPPSVPLVPNIVVSSSEGKAHDYWLIDPSTAPSVSDWQPIEDAWVNGLGGDQNARDAARILRLPGFFHVKDQENPQLVTAQYLREDPYTWAELVAAAPKAQQAQQNPKNATGAATGPSTWAMQSATEYADPQTVQDLRSALGFLKPDSDDRKTWIDVAHYLRKLGNTGFELWDTWSRASDKYDPLDQVHRWKTVHPDSVNVGYKAVFERAQAAGWVNTRAKVDPDTGEINQHVGGFGYTQAQVDEFKAADPTREFSYDNDTGSWHEVRKPEPTFTRVSLADVFTNPPPDQEYVWDGLIPRGVLTLLSANGGTGKSLKSLQLAAHRAVEKPFLGLQTKRTGKTLYFSAEDSTDIVRRRFASVCKADSLNPAEVSENLIVLDATDNPALYVEKMAAGVRGGEKTHAYNKLAAMIKDEGVDFLIVDNASDSYDADPIDRQRVGEFVRLLVKLVKAQQGTVLLLAHVNRNTARGHGSNSQDFADSAAWHNKARSRLFLKAEKENSPDLILEHQKANLGRKREPLLLTMREYGGVVLRGAGVDFSGLMARQEGREDDMAAAALLKILAEYESREQYASPSPTARNNVFSLLRADPLFKKLNLSAEDVKRLVQQSSRAAWIEPLEYKSAHTRKYCQRWTVTAKGKAHIDVCAPTSPTSPT